MKFLSHLALSLALLSPLSAEERQFKADSFTWNPELSKTGPLIITVSLKDQTAAVFRNGIRIGTAEVSTGRKGHETPTGVFHILNKDADHHSKTYNNASMPFSERLTWDGVALHAGSLPGHPSSHGCIHLPYEFSKKLFGITHKGTTVVISNGAAEAPHATPIAVNFQSGETTPFVWNPNASPSGPISLLFSSQDKKIFVIRNGIRIGECPVKTGFFSKHPGGTTAYAFDGWVVKSGEPRAKAHWHRVGGASNEGESDIDKFFKVDPRFQHLLEALLTPGTTFVVTNEAVTKETSSAPGFRVLQGSLEKKALKE